MKYIREFMLFEEYPNQDVFGVPLIAWPQERHHFFRALRLSRARAKTTQAITSSIMAEASATQTAHHHAALRAPS